MHAHLGHPGETMLQEIHHHVNGILKLCKPALYKCGTCTLVHSTKCTTTAEQVGKALSQPTDHLYTATPSLPEPNTELNHIIPGQVFQMDMGFVHGTKNSHWTADGDKPWWL